MKRFWATLCLLVAGHVLADGQTNGPAQTPEELGKRVAQALIAGDTNRLAGLLLTYEAYLPMAALYLGEGPHTEANLQKGYSRLISQLKEEVQAFPSQFEKTAGFKTRQIDGVDVARQSESGRPDWGTDVEITFRVKDAKFLLTLDECRRFSNAWHLIDLDWMGKQK